MSLLKLVLSLLISSTITFAAGSDGSILLPAQTTSEPFSRREQQRELSELPQWKTFAERNGGWVALWNEATRTPHRAFGTPIAITGYNRITHDNVETASRQFLREHAEALGILDHEVRFIRASFARNTWYVSYSQVSGGLDVMLSEIELRISPDARVFAFGADFFHDVVVPTRGLIPLEAAVGEAGNGLENPATRTEGRQFLLPVVESNAVRYHRVYEVFIDTESPLGRYVAYVDANDGQVIWRHNKVRHTEVRGRARGYVQLVLPTDPFQEMDFSRQHVTIGGVQVSTDSSGRFSHDIASPTTLTAQLSGLFVDVNRADGPDASITMPVNPGDSVNVLWNASNSHPAERDAYYHTDLIHRFITTLDPGFTFINYAMPCAVNINSTCNAYWDGFGINFFMEGGGCPNTAQMADVVYHEYGHGINDKLYQQEGSGFGMINGATHEGMADVVACLILDDNRLGRGFFGPNTVLRNLENTARYPQNVSPDPHITGLIIGGAFWDLRQATSLETARELSHFAKYGIPDDPNDGVAFGEWFMEAIIADDDDGNLANGTPHIMEIAAAFDAHGIGSSLFFTQSFLHQPLASTNDTTNAYPVIFQLGGIPIPGAEPESVMVHYSTDGFLNSIALLAAQGIPGEFTANIPVQPWGTVVRYYISASDGLSGARYTFPQNAPTSAFYSFMVGTQAAEAGILYASTQSSPSGALYTLGTTTGTATLVGPLGVNVVHALAVRPPGNELYGMRGSNAFGVFFRVSPILGDAFFLDTLRVGNARAMAFTADGETLYVGTTTGTLFRVVMSTLDTVRIGTASGISYGGLSFQPGTGVLYASTRNVFTNRDRIYTVNLSDGQLTLVGATGDGAQTPSLAFSPTGVLYGLKGFSTQINTLIEINTSTGAGDTVGSTGVQALQAIAMSPESLVTSVDDGVISTPSRFSLAQNFPNPFNPSTTITYTLPEKEHVILRVFNVLGQTVATLVDRAQEAGVQSVAFQANTLPSGVYFYRLEAGRLSETKKMALLK